MSVLTVVIIVATGLVLYYVGMVGYDLYRDKLSEANAETAGEELIDISDQLDSFDTLDVNPSPDQQKRVKKSVSKICKGLRAEEISGLMTQIAEGSQNETIENLRFECQMLQ